MMVRVLPAFKEYLWGGKALGQRFYPAMADKTLAESWILSAHPDGESHVLVKGETVPFSDFLRAHMPAYRDGDFPLLMKFIDAAMPLSVQVHPNDALAQKQGYPRGKTELWYILDAAEGAFLYYGLSHALSREALAAAAADGTLERHLRRLPVRRGDAVLVEAGTVHAIGAGILLCEIQESSNLTYRLYDYQRRDAQGQPRPLHLEQAVEAATLVPASGGVLSYQPQPLPGGDFAPIIRDSHFCAERFRVRDRMQIPAPQSDFCALTVLSGSGAFEDGKQSLPAAAGDTFFLCGGAKNLCARGKLTFMRAY